jgi:hypothetical protein
MVMEKQQRGRQEGRPTIRKEQVMAERVGHHALTVITERAYPSLVTQVWVDDKLSLMTINTGP